MSESLRTLVFVLIVSLPALFAGRRALAGIVNDAEITLWRNCWIATIAVLFISGNFIVFTAFLAGLSVYLRRHSQNPAYLYIVLLFVAPSLSLELGVPGLINKVIDINAPRVLALVLLLPAWRALSQERPSQRMELIDKLVILFVVLMTLLSARLGQPTHVMRVAVTNILDILLPYFVFSRLLKTTGQIQYALAAIVFAALPNAALGMLEFAKGWRLFNVVSESWGIYLVSPYLFRDGLLRAAVTSIEPIVFGFICMVALGCLICLRSSRLQDKWVLAALGILMGGLLASLSRGPWLGFAAMMFIALAFTRGGIVKLAVASVAVVAGSSLLFLTTFGQRAYNLLPFVGSVQVETEDYRQSLIGNSMIVIDRYPLFGTPYFRNEPEMLAMIQGQGIIDVVNTYLAIALEFGIVTLVVFMLLFMLLSVRLMVLCLNDTRPGISVSTFFGMLVAVLLTIGTVSSVSFIPYLYWLLAGFSVALLRVQVVVDVPGTDPEPARKLKVIGA